MKTLNAMSIGCVTLVGINYDKPFPWPSGNCFSLVTDEGEFRIVNFHYENFKHLLNIGLEWPVKIVKMNNRVAYIHDERISHKFYSDYFCETCCPQDLLPLPQKLSRERNILSGRLTIIETGKGYTLESYNLKPTNLIGDIK